MLGNSSRETCFFSCLFKRRVNKQVFILCCTYIISSTVSTCIVDETTWFECNCGYHSDYETSFQLPNLVVVAKMTAQLDAKWLNFADITNFT